MADTPDPARKPPRQAPPVQRAKPVPPPPEQPPAESTSKPPVKPAVPSGKPAVPTGKPVVRSVEPQPPARLKRAAPGVVPVGKLVTPASVAPPPPPSLDEGFPAASFTTGAAGQSSAHRARRRGTPAAVWGVIGLGVVGVAVLAIVLLMQRDNKDDSIAKPDKKAAAKDASKDETPNDKKSDEKKPADKDQSDAKPAEKDAKSANGKPQDDPTTKPKPPTDKPRDKPAEKPVTPAPEEAPAIVVKQFRGIEEVPTGDVPAALTNVITESVGLLKAGKFAEFFEQHVDPRDRGATPPAAARRTKNQSPYDVLAQGSEKTGDILAGIGDRKPHLFEDGKIAVFDLSPFTRPTFVEHEGRWYLSRGVKTHMERRFLPLTEEQEIIYLLEIAHGKPAVGPADAKREGTEQGIIEQLLQMGAYVALSHPDEEYRRSAVMLTEKFKGGDDGLALLGKLNEISQMTVLVVDGMSGSNITEEVGFMEFDGLTYLEYLRLTNIPPLQHPLTVHFVELAKLKTLIFDGGDKVSDSQISDHLRSAVELKRLSIKGSRISDSTLERLKMFTFLESVHLDLPPGSVTPAGIADLRNSKSGLWVDY